MKKGIKQNLLDSNSCLLATAISIKHNSRMKRKNSHIKNTVIDVRSGTSGYYCAFLWLV